MLPTPSTSHVDYNHVYEPAEDSFLMLDTLSSVDQTSFLHQLFGDRPSTPVVVEVGTGSGVILAFVAINASAILGRPDILCLGTDMNPVACKAAHITVASKLGICQASLTGCLRNGSVDLLLFNPPYVPSPRLPVAGSDLLALSYDGGFEGMEVTNEFLLDLPRVLSAEGVAYLLLCQQNRPLQVIERIRTWGWKADVVGRSGKTAGWEKLVILRISPL